MLKPTTNHTQAILKPRFGLTRTIKNPYSSQYKGSGVLNYRLLFDSNYILGMCCSVLCQKDKEMEVREWKKTHGMQHEE